MIDPQKPAEPGTFSIGLAVGEPGPSGGPTVDFGVGAMMLLGKLHGNRLLSQELFNSWIKPLGKIEREYRGLKRVPKRRKGRT